MALPETAWAVEDLPTASPAIPLTDQDGNQLYAQDGTPLMSAGGEGTIWTDE